MSAGWRAGPAGRVPDPELVAQAKRGTFSSEQKARIEATNAEIPADQIEAICVTRHGGPARCGKPIEASLTEND